MHCYRICPELYSTNTISKITQSHNHNTQLASNMNHVLPIKRTELGKNPLLMLVHKFDKKYPQILNHYPIPNLKNEISFNQ